MLVRYRQTKDGKREKLANIYSVEDHGIQRYRIDRTALAVTRRLQRAGYGAYIVGGAVRDLLLGKRPKDFDVVTDAPPRRIRKLFRNSRIIGNRFQLVHVYYGETIVEVSTFRTTEPETEDTIFGTMPEDVRRRDFTMNALFFDPESERIIDYVGGLDDIRAKRVRALVPAEASFREDPVRMIRALRYAATTGFELHGKISKQMRKAAPLIQECPISRLTEELFKILGSGGSSLFFESAVEHGLLTYLLPVIDKSISGKDKQQLRKEFLRSLQELDDEISLHPDIKKGAMLALLAAPFIAPPALEPTEPYLLRREVFLRIKELITPLTPPNLEVEMAAGQLLGIVPHRRRSRRKGRVRLEQRRDEL